MAASRAPSHPPSPPTAADVGVRISLGSDAHAAGQLEFLDFSIAAARRAGIPDDRIVNCMTVDELLRWTNGLTRSAG